MENIIELEINETYDLNNKDLNFENEYISITNGIVKGLKIGSTKALDYSFKVLKKHSLDNSFTLSYGRFSNKNLLVLGDSVSARETIGLANKTYSQLLKEKLNINELKNAAIGGTTLTYTYKGSNIYKEYWNNETAIDGCRVVKRLEDNNELDKFDYVIIAYGHNDQYFKPNVDEMDQSLNSLDDIHSFKKSFRYIVNTLKAHNPSIRILVLNCTYSTYGNDSPYGNGNSYEEFRKANLDMAKEFNLKYLDPWDYMKPYHDFDTKRFYYQDCVHMSPNGHVKLFEFLLNK